MIPRARIRVPLRERLRAWLRWTSAPIKRDDGPTACRVCGGPCHAEQRLTASLRRLEQARPLIDADSLVALALRHEFGFTGRPIPERPLMPGEPPRRRRPCATGYRDVSGVYRPHVCGPRCGL